MSEVSDIDEVIEEDIYVNDEFEDASECTNPGEQNSAVNGHIGKPDAYMTGIYNTATEVESGSLEVTDVTVGTKLDTAERNNIQQSMSVLIEEYGNTQAESILKEAFMIKTMHDRDKINCKINEYGKKEAKRKRIQEYCNKQADTILTEAFLIKAIFDKDKLNPAINNTLQVSDLPNAQGKRREPKRPGCDSYLLEKLLDSKADTSDENMFDGFEDIRDGARPGIHKQLNELKIEEGDSLPVSPRDLLPEPSEEKSPTPQQSNFSSDDFKAQKNIEDAFGDNLLQTINEDHELELKVEKIEEAVDVEKTEGTVDEQKIAETKETGGHVYMDVDNDQGPGDEMAGFHGIDSDATSLTEEDDMSTDSSDDDDGDEEDTGEMTYRQRKNVVRAVRAGNIDRLEDLLEKKNATMHMLWYKETLLMVAIRAEREAMCEFLIDNGIDLTFRCTSLDNKEPGVMKIYSTTAREMAYERGMVNIVDLLDLQDNNAFGLIKPRDRKIRLRRPKPPTPPPPPEETTDDDFSYDDDGDMCKLRDTKHDVQPNVELDMESGLHSIHTMDKQDKGASVDQESVHSRGSHGPSAADTSVFESRRKSAGYNDHCMDEGYETMSPVSPMCAPTFKLERNIVGTKDHVSLRGTRASNSIKMVTNMNMNSAKRAKNHTENVRTYTVGSYDVESRRWHRSQSAPTRKRLSCQSEISIDSAEIVRLGSPFHHGKNKMQTRNRNNSNSSHPAVRNVISPYSQVARLLSDSQHSHLRSSGSGSLLPAINHDHVIRPKSQPARKSSFGVYSNQHAHSQYERITYTGYSRAPTPPGVGLNKELLSRRKLRT